MYIGTSLQERGQFSVGPSAKTDIFLARQVRSEPAVEWSSGQPYTVAFVLSLFLESDAARRVAGTAMSKALDQIGATVPFDVLIVFVAVDRFVEKDPIPEGQWPAHVKWERNVGRPVRLMHRRYAPHEVSVERDNVFVFHFCVGRVRNRWIEVVTIL